MQFKESDDVDICILDAGLTDEQKTTLSKKVKQIKKAEWDIEVPGYKIGKKEWLKSQVSRAFLPKYFPGYKKYLWIDCDAWVNDWNSVELYFKACENGKLGITQTLGPGYKIMSKVKWLFGKIAIIKSQNFKHAISSKIGIDKARKLAFAPHINIGVFSLEENSNCWTDILRLSGHCLFWFLLLLLLLVCVRVCVICLRTFTMFIVFLLKLKCVFCLAICFLTVA